MIPEEADSQGTCARRRVATREARREWRSAAACQSCDPELFFPVSSSGPAVEQIARAKEICARCPVRPQCLAFALRTRQVYGLWGGLTEQERYLVWSRSA